MRLSTGDGYHVLFLEHWGSNIYRDVLPFIRELLRRWDAWVKPDGSQKGETLRISIGTHGSVKVRRNDGDWVIIGDRIVSAVRIDEVSKVTKPTEHSHWTIAVEQSFKNEVRLATKSDYDAIIKTKQGPFTQRDKAGKEHTFSLLTLIAPDSTGAASAGS